MFDRCQDSSIEGEMVLVIVLDAASKTKPIRKRLKT